MKTGRTDTIDPVKIARFRKDILALAKAAESIKRYSDIETLRKATLKWSSDFNAFGASLQDELRGRIRQQRNPDPSKGFFDVETAQWLLDHAKPFWDLQGDVRDIPRQPELKQNQYNNKWRPPEVVREEMVQNRIDYQGFRREDAEEWVDNFLERNPLMPKEISEANALALWKEKARKWATRVRAKARLAWDFLAEVIKLGETDQEPINIVSPESENVVVEGFQIEFRGFDESHQKEYLAPLKEALKLFRAKAQQRAPILLKKLTPFTVQWTWESTASSQASAFYDFGHIYLTPWVLGADLLGFVKTMAHEMGHHLHRTYLSSEATKHWHQFVQGDKVKLNLHEALKTLRSLGVKTFLDNKLQEQEPILALQLLTLVYDHRYKDLGLFSTDDLQDYLSKGNESDMFVPASPVSGYGGKNSEEAFCEALGLLVAYGPRAVLPSVRSMLQLVLPDVRVSSQREAMTGYYDPEGPITLQEVARRWQEDGDKMFDRSQPIMAPVSDVWKHREYTWTRETSRSGYAQLGKDAPLFPGPLKWDALREELRLKGWSQNDPIIMFIGQSGGMKVGEGNHRLALARDLGMKTVPVRFVFNMGRVTKTKPEKEPSVVTLPPKVLEQVIEQAPASPRDQAQVDEIMDLLFSRRSAEVHMSAITLAHRYLKAKSPSFIEDFDELLTLRVDGKPLKQQIDSFLTETIKANLAIHAQYNKALQVIEKNYPGIKKNYPALRRAMLQYIAESSPWGDDDMAPLLAQVIVDGEFTI